MNLQRSLAGKRQQRLCVRYRQIRVFRRQWQINYTIHALICALTCASVTTAQFHHMEQSGNWFTPHILLPHWITCYYSRIILSSLPLLLFSELFQHYYLRPNLCTTDLQTYTDLQTCTRQLMCIHTCKPSCWTRLSKNFYCAIIVLPRSVSSLVATADTTVCAYIHWARS